MEISIDLTTGALVADGDVISESLCLPFFGDIVLGECTSVPKLKLCLFTGVDCSMVPPTDGTMCSAWDIALTNEDSDANFKLEKYEVAVRFQEMQQVPVTPALGGKRKSAGATAPKEAKRTRATQNKTSDPQPPQALVLAAPSDPEPPASLAGLTQDEQQHLVEVVATFDAYRIVATKGGRGGVLCRLADDDTPRMFSKMVATVNASVTKAASTCGIIKAEAPAVAETRTKLQTKSNKAKPEVFIKHIHG